MARSMKVPQKAIRASDGFCIPQFLALNCSWSAFYSYYDFLEAWRAYSTNFLLAWSAIPFVQHSPCMFYEGV